jgi:hypothetical protein
MTRWEAIEAPRLICELVVAVMEQNPISEISQTCVLAEVLVEAGADVESS